MRARSLVLLLAFALLGSACTLPGNIRGSREITATFDDVGDLVAGHSVQVADVRVGSVTDIELTEDFRATVTMSLKDGVFIPRESRAVLRTTSLLGEKFVELRPIDQEHPMSGTDIVDGDVIAETLTAPELEFVAERAAEILGAVVASDIATLVETGSVGFGGRADELRTIVQDLSTISGTLADQTDELVRIVTALDGATERLARGASDIDALLTNLAETAGILADSRNEAIDAIDQLTRLATAQNRQVFEPYLEEVNRQIVHVDAIVAEISRDQTQLAELLYWLGQFTVRLPLAAPGDFAQIYGLIEPVS